MFKLDKQAATFHFYFCAFLRACIFLVAVANYFGAILMEEKWVLKSVWRWYTRKVINSTYRGCSSLAHLFFISFTSWGFDIHLTHTFIPQCWWVLSATFWERGIVFFTIQQIYTCHINQQRIFYILSKFWNETRFLYRSVWLSLILLFCFFLLRLLIILSILLLLAQVLEILNLFL